MNIVLQNGSLVVNGVITPRVNGLVNGYDWGSKPYKWSYNLSPYLSLGKAHLVEWKQHFQVDSTQTKNNHTVEIHPRKKYYKHHNPYASKYLLRFGIFWESSHTSKNQVSKEAWGFQHLVFFRKPYPSKKTSPTIFVFHPRRSSEIPQSDIFHSQIPPQNGPHFMILLSSPKQKHHQKIPPKNQSHMINVWYSSLLMYHQKIRLTCEQIYLSHDIPLCSICSFATCVLGA